jgi:hypothetical protein
MITRSCIALLQGSLPRAQGGLALSTVQSVTEDNAFVDYGLTFEIAVSGPGDGFPGRLRLILVDSRGTLIALLTTSSGLFPYWAANFRFSSRRSWRLRFSLPSRVLWAAISAASDPVKI